METNNNVDPEKKIENIKDEVNQFPKVLDKIRTYFNSIKSYISSIKMPRMLDFIIKLDAKDPYQPTLKEAIKDAPPPSQNWVRLGLNKMSTIGLPVWYLFAAIGITVAAYMAIRALNVILLIICFGLFLFILYSMWKKFTGKT